MAEGCYNPKEHYLPGSYNGIPFEAMDVSSEHGRRGAEGEFVFGEQTGYVDLGIKIRRYSINGRFTGNNHLALAEALVRMAELPGPGILIHPTRGILRVAVKFLRLHDNPTEEAGITNFEAEFVEANILGSGLQTLLNAVNIGSRAFLELNSSSFKSHYQPAQAGAYARPAIIGVCASGIAAIGSAYATASIGGDDADARGQILAQFDSLQQDSGQLADAGTADLAAQNGLDFINRDAISDDARMAALRSVMNWAAQSVEVSAGAAVQVNAVYAYMRLSALARLTDAYLAAAPDNLAAGLADAAAVDAVLSQEMAAAQADCADSCLYLALADYAANARYAMLSRAYGAGALITYNLPGATHMLVAAWEVYGDAKRIPDILRFNSGLPWSIGPGILAKAG